MTVLVSKLRRVPARAPARVRRLGATCYLFADPALPRAQARAELHEFAARIGMKRSWFHERPHLPVTSHYDLGPGMRRRALELGARELDGRELQRFITAALVGRREKAV